MTDIEVRPNLSDNALSILIHGAFQGFTGAAERLEQAYATLREQVAALDVALNETNHRLAESLQENTRMRCYLSNLLKSMEKGIVAVDSSGRITLWSGGAERLTGFTVSEASGRQADHLLGRDVGDLLRGGAGNGHESTREGRIARKDGYILEAEIGTAPICDEEGQVLDTLVIFDDISQRKWNEERRRRSTAQAGLEQMAVTIAHEIRSPLTSIELLATILAEEAAADAHKNRLAQGIQAGVASVNIILTNLLTFSRPIKPCVKAIELHEVIEEALRTAWYALKEQRIDLIRVYDSGALEVDADRELVKQVFLNLILNAVQAMPSGGRLTIRTTGRTNGPKMSNGSRVVADDHRGERRPEPDGVGGGRFVEIKISDSGCGIAEANLDQIFLPFFTTKPKGTGLGLAIVERILEQHGARVSVESWVGQGTTFTILFGCRRRNSTIYEGSC